MKVFLIPRFEFHWSIENENGQLWDECLKNFSSFRDVEHTAFTFNRCLELCKEYKFVFELKKQKPSEESSAAYP